MNRRFTFIVGIIGGFFIAAGAFQVWSGSTSGNPFTALGILIFIVGWVMGWAGIYELTNLMNRRRIAEMDTLEPNNNEEEVEV